MFVTVNAAISYINVNEDIKTSNSFAEFPKKEGLQRCVSANMWRPSSSEEVDGVAGEESFNFFQLLETADTSSSDEETELTPIISQWSTAIVFFCLFSTLFMTAHSLV